MASIVGYGSKHSHEFTLTVNEDSISQSGNYSTVSFSFTLYKSSYSWSGWNSISYIVTINGQQYTGTIPSYSAGSTKTITSGTLTVPHDSNGSKTLYFSFSVTDSSGQSYTCGNASASGSMALTSIARQPSKPTLTVTNVSDTSFTVFWSTNMIIDAVWYSADGGTVWGYVNNPNKSSGSLRFTPAVPNTTYRERIRVRGKDSQLTTDSDDITVTTLDHVRISSIDETIHGEPIKLNVTCPADTTPITLTINVSGTDICTRNISKGNVAINLTDSELDTLYSFYGNNNSVTATFTVTSNGYSDTATANITLKGNQKTSYSNINSSWKRGKVYVNVNGTWKRGVVWTKISGSWKRGA